jgi:hypothetical protein
MADAGQGWLAMTAVYLMVGWLIVATMVGFVAGAFIRAGNPTGAATTLRLRKARSRRSYRRRVYFR